MTPYNSDQIPVYIRLFAGTLILLTGFFIFIGCSTTQKVVEKTTKTVTRTTRDISRKIALSDEDLKRKVGMFNFGNNILRKTQNFQEIFHKGLPEYLNDHCPGIILLNPSARGLLNTLKEPPKLKSGLIDGYALTILGRQLGLNAVVTGSLEDIRVIDELQGVLWTKDTQHLVLVFIRVEVFDTRTATKILDNTFDRRIEIDDLEYRMIQENEHIKLPELNETLNRLLTDIGDSICDAIRDQPWDGYITEIDGDRYLIPSGTEVGLEPGDILEVFDGSRIMEGVGGQHFFVPGLKIGEIEIVAITQDRLEAKLVSGENIKKGSTVRRK
jgi:urease beta subunit